ncbi:hypothetical protein CLOP_g18608 [Closterium sp. NIES-67]|nr:hypothetical protein CLOP_g18608 [Closterium sp. NIES-67]
MAAHEASDLVIVLANDKYYGRKKLISICQEAVACGPSESVSVGTHPKKVSFQSVLLPMLRVICQPEFCNNPASSKVNTTLAAIVEVEGFQEYLVSCMRLLTQRGTIGDSEKNDVGVKDWDTAFQIVISFFNLTMDRFYSLFDATQASTDMQELESMLGKWQAEKPVFDGKYHSLCSTISRLRKSLDRRSHRERHRQSRESGQTPFEVFYPSGRQLSITQGVDGPGELSLDGHPRHDNDHVDISAISVAPTMEEVLCKVSPYLPRNNANEPHHLPHGSVGRHVDIQFRLLRHDLVAPLWNKAFFLLERLKHGPVLRKSSSCTNTHREGAMTGLVRADRTLVKDFAANMKGIVGFSSDDMDVYLLQDVRVLSINADKRSGVYFLIDFMEPPISQGGRPCTRMEFWERTKRLQNGSLVCLWIQDISQGHRGDPAPHNLVFGTITARETRRLANQRPQIGVQPCQGNRFSADLLELISHDGSANKQVFMLEAHGSFFAYEPILKALQNITEASFPFSEYICGASSGAATSLGTKLPAYVDEDMLYDLSLLLQTKASPSQPEVTAEDSHSMKNVLISKPAVFPIDALLRCTSLDRPQAVALQAALTQDFALLQGPPGTGKTFVGIKLVELLLNNALKNSVDGSSEACPKGPILCVCFTNHALDQFLEGLIASGINNVVRVGGRSRSESLQKYNLFNIIQDRSPYHSQTYKASRFLVHTRMREVEIGISTYSGALRLRRDDVQGMPWRFISPHLMANHPVFFEALRGNVESQPMLFEDLKHSEHVVQDHWNEWKRGLTKEESLRKIALQEAGVKGAGEAASAASSHAATAPIAPSDCSVDESSDRAEAELLQVADPWATSLKERLKLMGHWVEELHVTANAVIEAEVENHAKKVAESRELMEIEDLQILKKAQVVGMTTSGVAKMQRLITALGPRVIIVEEAAEVLEAHILTSLTPQTQHVILIGDHLQLRPKVEVYELSKDSHKGFDLDVSLFERLALSKQIPVHTLATQRRMRPEIADLIRSTIYPQLTDHPSVQSYPNVRGMETNLHFWDHDSPERGGDDLNESKSKTNEEEVGMVVGLAKYLLQQGFLGGDITILTPYVGQLLKLRQALSEVVNVRLGESDAEVVEEAEEKAAAGEGGSKARDGRGSGNSSRNSWEQSKGPGSGGSSYRMPTTADLKDEVRLATVDNFQGEESMVVIVSLVRNNLDGKIGFLKSPNRTNVLLSRAKHGMYLIGNASTMRADPNSLLWPKILDILQTRNAIQRFIPLQCVNHTDTVTHIQHASEFNEKASEGGCSKMCGFRLTPCGHTCPRRCHGDNRAHANAFCPKECNRIRPLDQCPFQHPCPKQCGEDCGDCKATVKAVTLPCGHKAVNIHCFEAQKPSSISCSATVEVTMPLCGHKQNFKCSEAAVKQSNPKLCTARCGVVLSDSCGHECNYRCGDCIIAPDDKAKKEQQGQEQQATAQQQQQQQQRGKDMEVQKKHKACILPCKRPHPCSHLCPDICHNGKDCKPCCRKCLVACQHSYCSQPCHRTCAPCTEPCVWHCKHQGSCSLPCGAPCDRLPCDKRCEEKLKCGHQCPSLCGEKCPSRDFCTVPKCGSKAKRETIVDLVTLETLGEVDPDENPILVLACGHAYTVETLDGHLGLDEVYLQSETPGGSGGGVAEDTGIAGSGAAGGRCVEIIGSVGGSAAGRKSGGSGGAGGGSAAGSGSGGSGGAGGGSSGSGAAGSGSGPKWVAVLPFEDGNLSALKGCPDCRQPITGLLRYGRMVNKALLDQSELKFVLTCSADQEVAHRRLSRLSRAVARCPEDAPPFHLQELAQSVTGFMHEAERLRVTSMNPPTWRTYQASIAALQRKHMLLEGWAWGGGRGGVSGADSPAVPALEEECRLLHVPQPDTRPLCEALIILGKSHQQLMTLNFFQLRGHLKNLRSATGQGRGQTAEHFYRCVHGCRMTVHSCLNNARECLVEAFEWAGKRKAHRLEARARLELVDVYRAFVEGMMAERLLASSIVDLNGSRAQQLEYLEKAKIQCHMVAYHHLVSVRENSALGESARRILNKELPALETSVRDEPRYFVLTEREKEEVYRAMDLGGGHWYRCRNGHVYAIGECGGAMQESSCPECGEVVGGSSHVLREGNTSAADFFSGQNLRITFTA